MECNQTLIAAYLDQELDPSATAVLTAHLQDCAACRGTLDTLRSLNGSLQSTTRHVAPGQLRSRIQADLNALKTSPASPAAARPKFWNWLSAGIAGAGSLALACSLVLYLSAPSAQSVLNQDIAASHYRSLLADHLADVASSDHHTVKPWFTGKLDYAPVVRDFAAQGFPLLGGRLDYLNQRTVAALAYRHNNHLINVFMWPEPSDKTATLTAVHGFNLLQWSENGMHYSAISDMNAQELESLRHLMMEHAEPSAQ